MLLPLAFLGSLHEIQMEDASVLRFSVELGGREGLGGLVRKSLAELIIFIDDSRVARLYVRRRSWHIRFENGRDQCL